MRNTRVDFSSIARFSITFGLMLISLMAIAESSLAEYEPQGGEPPDGGSTTSRVLWESHRN